jgi:hypothetical protein
MAISEAWIGLLGALGGVVLTGAIGLLTAQMTHRWERDKQAAELLLKRSELRRDAYSRLLASAQSLVDNVDLWKIADPSVPDTELVLIWYRTHADLVAEHQSASHHARFVASDSVDQAIGEWEDFFATYLLNAAGSYTEGYKREHGFPDVDFHPFVDSARPIDDLLQAMRQEQGADLPG